MPLLTTQSAKGYGFNNLITVAGSGSFESIASTVLSSNTSSVNFSSIPSTFQHLQLRMELRDNQSSSAGGYYYDLTFNNNTSSGYSYMYGEVGTPPSNTNFATGGSNSTTTAYGPYFPTALSASSVFGVVILDIFDYANTNKATTFTHTGAFTDGSNARFAQMGGHWLNNSAVNQITISHPAGSFVTGCTFSLYGIKNS